MATISLLPVSLALVHVPRSRLPQLTHPVLQQILQPNPAFLNVTCNEIELTIFAERRTVKDFELIARKDRQKLRSKVKSSRMSLVPDALEPIEITYESWSVLQIDSHNDQMGNSGARVNELSAPLAEAGISILYQSSYMSDFIFVKEARLQEVMQLFASAGFDLYSAESNILESSPISPPNSPLADDRASIAESTVLTRSRSSTDPPTPSSTDSQESTSEDGTSYSPRKSRSPTTGQVDVLSPDLTCVGLSDDSVEHWTLKIVKLIAFPDLIPTSSLSSEHDFTYTYAAFTPRPRKTDSLSHPASPSHSPRPASPSSDFSSPLFSSDDEEGYFSHSPSGNMSSSSLVTSAASKSLSDLTKSSGGSSHRHSISEGSISSHSSRSSHLKSSKHLIQPMTPITTPPSIPIQESTLENFSLTDQLTPSAGITPMPSPHQNLGAQVPQYSLVPLKRVRGSKPAYKVPFFSFTRTPEGSSLTTSAGLLAVLFPPSERHMVICGGELDGADERMARQERGIKEENDTPDDDDASNPDSTLKCLQIDLRKYGLDKHGLVHRFSRVLEENEINHMYSATFKTANLLVDKKHARRAQGLIQSC